MSDRETIIEAMSWCEDFDTGRWGREKAEALLAAHDEAIRADQAERIAVALSAEQERIFQNEDGFTCDYDEIAFDVLGQAAITARTTDTKAGAE